MSGAQRASKSSPQQQVLPQADARKESDSFQRAGTGVSASTSRAVFFGKLARPQGEPVTILGICAAVMAVIAVVKELKDLLDPKDVQAVESAVGGGKEAASQNVNDHPGFKALLGAIDKARTELSSCKDINELQKAFNKLQKAVATMPRNVQIAGAMEGLRFALVSRRLELNTAALQKAAQPFHRAIESCKHEVKNIVKLIEAAQRSQQNTQALQARLHSVSNKLHATESKLASATAGLKSSIGKDVELAESMQAILKDTFGITVTFNRREYEAATRSSVSQSSGNSSSLSFGGSSQDFGETFF